MEDEGELINREQLACLVMSLIFLLILQSVMNVSCIFNIFKPKSKWGNKHVPNAFYKHFYILGLI